ncbi:hypothetical protein PV735_38765 [Streptomyces turgidiscabies]|uniref:hypothetical protein n=1 Tax=Streptomyces TaxID=1883 RepID=UPI00076EC9EB|nr:MULTISPECIES: hypothetical protein [Streptomyces]MDX3498592.1 hypothetical protein [Streptomyces turgidiscabies]GAQ73608.1 hypothetical protein T45_05368 [Streptomyces turgidiscabies]
MRYEYKRLTSSLGRLLTEPELNALGTEGWNLIHVIGTTWYFQRELKVVTPRQTRTKKEVTQ